MVQPSVELAMMRINAKAKAVRTNHHRLCLAAAKMLRTNEAIETRKSTHAVAPLMECAVAM